jgi:hypothetical protein
VDGYVYRQTNTLKNGDIVYVCSVKKKCKKSITTDPDGVAIVKTRKFMPHSYSSFLASIPVGSDSLP